MGIRSPSPRPKAVDFAYQIHWNLIRNEDADADQIQAAAEGEHISRDELLAAKRIVAMWAPGGADENFLEANVLEYFIQDARDNGYCPIHVDEASVALEILRKLERQFYQTLDE